MKRPEYRPIEKFPDTIYLDCGCILRKEKKGDNKGAYYVESFCEEHDPSYWENYPDED